MIDNKILKFESPARIAELNPMETLKRAGLNEKMTVCDIGAGTGVFAFPAAEITDNTVYALDISDGMIELLERRKTERGIENLQIRKVVSSDLPVENNAVDLIIMVTVLHEIEDKVSLFAEIRRILRAEGKMMVIEFHKKETPMGPPVDHRISEDSVEEILEKEGFDIEDKVLLGENFYGIVASLR
ncbi:MAG: class I SAM-dependent methyltransferase [Clostridiaceae bacterium]